MKRDRQGARHRRQRDIRRAKADTRDRRPLWVREGWPMCPCGAAPLKIHSPGRFVCVKGHDYRRRMVKA